MRRALTSVVAACVLFGLPGATVAEDPGAPAAKVESTADAVSRPNIVVFYIDDAAPHDGRLWNDPSRTPNIHDRFINNGVEFTDAIGEVPLCCPARGSLLTGLHTHNNGLVDNNALLFDPSEHIGRAMQDAGYASMFIGKYLNRNNELTPAQWDQHDAGWTHLDVIKGVNGSFLNFTLHTKDVDFKVRGLHSTQMVGDRMVTRLRETPADQPVFAVLSIYNLHGPNTPMAQDIGDPRCASMPPWNPPSYNEADVSDKPAGIQALPPLPYPDGWPMVRYCEEMLGVDRVVGQVTSELAAQGRLENTLFVFTADNGISWGEHRLGQHKSWPYTTPVPLYMSWAAAGWGAPASQVDELVSNIDLAPTFCDLAATCHLGPFARGNNKPDGKSLVRLIEGDDADLGRDAVLEASYIKEGFSYSALRTTARFDPDERWHYVEYTNGARELYDLVADPWEMDNRASDPAYAEVIAELSDLLAELRMEGVAPGQGNLRIRLDAAPDRSADYTFGGDLGAFTLDDDADPALPNERFWTGVGSGIYEITRASVAPWVAFDIVCDGAYFTEVGLGRLLVYVHPTATVTCTFLDSGPRPDAMVALSTAGPYRKDNLYQLVPARKQTVKRIGVVVGGVYEYRLRLQNDSRMTDWLTVRPQASGPSTVSAAYFVNDVDVTAAVMGGWFSTGDLLPGAYIEMVIHVTIGAGTPRRPAFKLVLPVSSGTSPSAYDAARIVAAP